MSVGRKVGFKGEPGSNTGAPERKFTIVGLSEKYKIIKEIESRIFVSNSDFYIKYNGRYYWLYEWDGSGARYAILLYEPTENIN